MPERFSSKRAVMARIQLTPTHKSPTASRPSQDSSNNGTVSDPCVEDPLIDDLALQLMASVLSDDSPDPNLLDDRLWKSRAEALQDSDLGDAPSHLSSISLNDVTSGIHKLSTASSLSPTTYISKASPSSPTQKAESKPETILICHRTSAPSM